MSFIFNYLYIDIIIMSHHHNEDRDRSCLSAMGGLVLVGKASSI
jgi:hypothetical protein